MIVTLLPENLSLYLPLLNKILPTHSQVPILGNVLLKADNTGFYIKATDLEMGCEIKIPAKVEREGAITVPGKEFIETINSLPADKITLTLERESLTLECRGNKVVFNTISADEFPQLFKEKGVVVAEFERGEFVDTFSYLLFSVSTEDSRPQLTGVYIDKKEDSVNFVSTDGYRMSVKSVVKKETKIKEGLIVAVELLNEVIALKSAEIIRLFLNKEENQILFEVGDAVIVGRMIEGAFPDYEKVISKESETKVIFDREELLQNVKLASVFARDNSNIVSMDIRGNSATLSTKSQGVGEGEAVIECQKTGEDNKIAFNIRYLMDIVKTVNEKSIELRLNSSMEPAIFEVKEKNYIHVIMPIQVDS